MIEQSYEEPNLPSQEIIKMIQEFVGCLNYPKTKAMLTHEKSIKIKQWSKEEDHQKEKMEKIQRKNEEEDGYELGRGLFAKQQKTDNVNLSKLENNSNQSQMINESEQGNHHKNGNQFAWKHEQAKFYSKFATFSEIVYCLQTSAAGRQLSDSKLKESMIKNTNNQVCQQALKLKPTLLHIFSAFDTISKLKKFVVPIYRNLCIEPKFSKPTKFMQVSPRDHYLLIVDQQSTFVLVNLQQKTIMQHLRIQQKQQITCIRWLNNGTAFAAGTASGKVIIWEVARDKQLNKLHTLAPHLQQNNLVNNSAYEIISLYNTKDYLYSCSSDYTIAKTYIKNWKTERITSLKSGSFKKMAKIQHKKLKDIIFGVQKSRNQLIMLDQITGLSTVIFSINKEHIRQCRKVWNKQNQPFQQKQIAKNSWIQDIITNNDNNTLIVSVAGVNPSIYEIDPLRNQISLRLNYESFKQHELSIENYRKLYEDKTSNIHMTLSHKSELLVITTNSRLIFFVRIKNWRVLYEYKEMQNGIKFGPVAATRRFADSQQSMIQNKMQIEESENHRNSKKELQQKQKKSILCILNPNNSNIEIYENQKHKLKIIRSDIQRTSRSLIAGQGLPTNAEGFLQLLQTIRQNYQAFS